MTLQIKPIRGNKDVFIFEHTSGNKTQVWHINRELTDEDLDALMDIVNTAHPDYIQPTTPAIPLDLTSASRLEDFRPVYAVGPAFSEAVNSGAEAADRAAREEEMRLRNMGSAISKGLELGPEDIPVFNGEVGDGLPPVNWGV